MAEERQGGEHRAPYNRDNREERGSDRREERGGDRPQGSRFGGSQAPREGGDRPSRPSGPRRGGGGGRYSPRRKVCAFCVDNIVHVDYKDLARLRRHIGERGKIEPRRKLGTCAKHQRSLTVAIKRARYIGLIPFTSSNSRG